MLVQRTIKRSRRFLASLAPLPIMSALWDYENRLLSRYNIELGMPVGLERLTHEHWVRHVKSDLPNSDWTWEQYVAHVEAAMATIGSLSPARKTLRLRQLRQQFEQQRRLCKKQSVVSCCAVSFAQSKQTQVVWQKAERCFIAL